MRAMPRETWLAATLRSRATVENECAEAICTNKAKSSSVRLSMVVHFLHKRCVWPAVSEVFAIRDSPGVRMVRTKPSTF
jgi:hypothetical protein